MFRKITWVRQLSLRARLLLAAGLWLSGMILAAGLIIPNLLHQYLEDELKQQLTVSMDEISANLDVNKEQRLTLTSRLSDARFSRPYSGLYWKVSTTDHVLRSRSLWDKDITMTHPNRQLLGAQGEPLVYIERDLFLPDFDAPLYIVIGIDERPLRETLRGITYQLWIILAMLFTGVMVIIAVQVQWSLRPLNKLQRELNDLKAGDKNTLSETYPREVSPLITDLNALLFHYQELLQRARHHAGNLSHALKTPLAALRNDVNELPEDTQHRLKPAVDQMQNQIDYHLGRSRMAGSVNILSVGSNVSERIDAMSTAFDKVYAHHEILLINELDLDVEVAVEQKDLDEILGNVIENGYKWANSLIRIYSEAPTSSERSAKKSVGYRGHKAKTSSYIDIIIEDDGRGVPSEQVAMLTQRGVRLDESISGSGLGLNIVKEMMHSYRGEVSFDVSPLGGLSVKLRFKLAQ